MLTLIIINVTAFIAGWMLRGYWRRPARDDRSEQILKHLASWVSIMRGRPSDRLIERVADQMLYSAAVIHYRDRTDAMGSYSAARWIRERVNDLVAEVAPADTNEEKP